MTKVMKMVNIEPLEISLGDEGVKNRRRLLTMKNKKSDTKPVEEAKVEESAVATEEEVKEDSPELEAKTVAPEVAEKTDEATPEPVVVDAPELSNDVAAQAFHAISRRSKVVPKAVSEAAAFILAQAGIDNSGSEDGFSEEDQVHVKSLLGLIPEEAPDEVKEAAKVLNTWGEEGYMLEENFFDESPMEAPVQEIKRRVVRSEKLIAEAEDTAGGLIEMGETELAGQIMGFSKAIKKSLPNGGLVVIAGVVASSKDIEVVNLSEVWQTNDPDLASFVQGILDRAAAICLSAATQAKEEAETALIEFAADISNVIGSDFDEATKRDQVQHAFNDIGVKMAELLTKSLGDQKAADTNVSQTVMSTLSEISDRLAKAEAKLATPALLNFDKSVEGEKKTRDLPPARRSKSGSMASTLLTTSTSKARSGKPMTASDIVDSLKLGP